MNQKRIFGMLISILLFTSLACNLSGGGQTPTDVSDQPPASEEAGANPTAPVAEIPSDECENPLLPIKAGAQWTYDLQGIVADTFTRVILSVDGNSFKDQDTFGAGTVRQGEWKCESGNLIALNPSGGSTASVSASGETSTFISVNNQGVTLPALVNSGDSWSQSVTFEGINNASGTPINTRNTFSTSCTALGMENVTVPAGSFDAMKVECATKIEISTLSDSGEASAPFVLDTQNVSWYAPNIGWVKSIGTGGGIETTIQLTGYQIP